MAAYPKFDPLLMDGTVDDGATILAAILQQDEALLDAAQTGMPVDWNGAITTPGTQPDVLVMTDSADTDRKVRMAITWGTTGGEAFKPTVITFERSVDAGVTWTDVKTMTMTWNASGYYVSHAWS